MLTELEVHEKLREIASKFDLFQCQACADTMKRWLISHRIHGIYIKITACSSDFIISERMGGDMSITQNGCHYGVEALGKVFDNLPRAGMTKQSWLDDFESIGGFDIEETHF